jgi:hypothetical protein
MQRRNAENNTILPFRVVVACVFTAVMAGSYVPSVAAQDTRAGEIAKKQAEKAANTSPYRPSGFEKFMNNLEETFTSPPSGFYPNVGSVYSGGGLAGGVGYRQFFARKAVWNVSGLYSIRSYKRIDTAVRTPWDNSGRIAYGVRAGWLDATQIGFYGLGMSSESADRANYRLKQTHLGGNIEIRPTRWTRLEGDIAVEDITSEEGLGRSPSIETRFTPFSAPGLFSNPTYIHSEATAAIDWRTSRGYSRTGGYYGVKFVDYSDRDDTYSFRRVDGEIIQHIPVLRETWVFSFRGRVQSTLGDDDIVPYYLLPSLGSGSTLRAYATGRFRDRHSLLTSAEFRWIPNRLAMDMALFYDAGKVASRREDLDFDGVKSNWGIGARFHARSVTVLRIELARGDEGWHLVVATRAAF